VRHHRGPCLGLESEGGATRGEGELVAKFRERCCLGSLLRRGETQGGI
jgi:hypothetical protein